MPWDSRKRRTKAGTAAENKRKYRGKRKAAPRNKSYNVKNVISKEPRPTKSDVTIFGMPGNVLNVGTHNAPFPQRLSTSLDYLFEDRITTDGTAAGLVGAEKVFRMNSIYDPNYTDATGKNNTTVTGHGVYAGIYNKYLVDAVTFTVVWSNPSIDGVAPVVSCNQTLPIQSQDVRTVGERQYNYVYPMVNSGKQKVTRTYKIKPWTLLGLSKLEYYANASVYCSNISSNPAQECYIRIGAAMLDDDSGLLSQSVMCTLRIRYHVTLYDRKTLTPT